ncbi:hypothetical protein FGADI_12038 [Fusarium gaditjirri]|uniref:MOSC domain-containing protein n=1 Tax=Fusarium gaditjirri TaxID=282569 RepID=A0A8H4ST70_9HYPO|nr:hypothetical protein FGADI_12038 [Fusarium gaditjirri]
MNDDNVCIGDIYQLGKDVLLQVSEPRHPCFKLNSRFKWPRTLKRTIRKGRAGWNMRVLKTGNVCKGDTTSLIDRPYPECSVLNVQRVIRARNVSLNLLAECSQLPMTDLFLDIAKERLRTAPKTYTLVEARLVAQRVRMLTFALKEPLTLVNPEFEPYDFAQIKFGREPRFERSDSIVGGDTYRFSLGVTLDRQSRGGSAYLHKELKISDEIEMSPGSNPGAQEHDAKCDQSLTRILIVGGIGITAFLPSIRNRESKGLPYELHYTMPSLNESAFLDHLNKDYLILPIRGSTT